MTEIPAWYEWSFYQSATRRTVQKYLTKQERHYQNSIGLIGETTEVAELLLDTEENIRTNKNEIIKELGDTLWYMSRLLDDFDLDMQEIAGTQMIDAYNCSEWVNEYKKLEEMGLENLSKLHAKNLVSSAGKIVESLKKHFFQKHELDLSIVKIECRHMLKEMALIAILQECTMEDIARLNIEKSRKRYPDGFTKDNSVFRFDLDE